MNKKKIIKEVIKKPNADTVISTIGNRSAVGNVKKGVNLLGIVQKLTQKRAAVSEEESSKENDFKLTS